MLVTPSRKAQERLKAKVKEMTSRRCFRDVPLLKFGALKALLQGWMNYYRHCNAKETAKNLDFWVNRRLFWWLQKRHRLSARQIMAKYKLRQGRRANVGIRNGETILYLYRMSDQPITKYKSRKPVNPYLGEDWHTTINRGKAPLHDQVWLGNAANNEQWRELKAEIKAEQGMRCEHCGSYQKNLDLHHIKARRYGGQSTKANAQLLCEPCHVQTPTYGDHSRLQ
jgi:5-methylcytosine-specific restriction endonuclease McrA